MWGHNTERKSLDWSEAHRGDGVRDPSNDGGRVFAWAPRRRRLGLEIFEPFRSIRRDSRRNWHAGRRSRPREADAIPRGPDLHDDDACGPRPPRQVATGVPIVCIFGPGRAAPGGRAALGVFRPRAVDATGG